MRFSTWSHGEETPLQPWLLPAPGERSTKAGSYSAQTPEDHNSSPPRGGEDSALDSPDINPLLSPDVRCCQVDGAGRCTLSLLGQYWIAPFPRVTLFPSLGYAASTSVTLIIPLDKYFLSDSCVPGYLPGIIYSLFLLPLPSSHPILAAAARISKAAERFEQDFGSLMFLVT